MKILENMSTKAKAISAIVAAITAVGGLSFGALEFVDTRYAHASDLAQLEKRVTLAELKELYRKALDNMYHYRDLAKRYPDDEEIKQKLKEAEGEVKYLREEIRKAEKKESGE